MSLPFLWIPSCQRFLFRPQSK